MGRIAVLCKNFLSHAAWLSDVQELFANQSPLVSGDGFSSLELLVEFALALYIELFEVVNGFQGARKHFLQSVNIDVPRLGLPNKKFTW